MEAFTLNTEAYKKEQAELAAKIAADPALGEKAAKELFKEIKNGHAVFVFQRGNPKTDNRMVAVTRGNQTRILYKNNLVSHQKAVEILAISSINTRVE